MLPPRPVLPLCCPSVSSHGFSVTLEVLYSALCNPSPSGTLVPLELKGSGLDPKYLKEWIKGQQIHHIPVQKSIWDAFKTIAYIPTTTQIFKTILHFHLHPIYLFRDPVQGPQVLLCYPDPCFKKKPHILYKLNSEESFQLVALLTKFLLWLLNNVILS